MFCGRVRFIERKEESLEVFLTEDNMERKLAGRAARTRRLTS